MKGKRRAVAALALVLTLALGLLPAGAAGTPARTRSNGRPYFIAVNRATCTVTVYTLDDSGSYTVPYKAMVCSVGKPGRGITPTGSFTLSGYNRQWCYMRDGSYGQYACQFKGSYLFHSVCYNKADPSTLMTYEYNDLGRPASLGCVRLQTADAKWIYDNCAGGTQVRIFDGVAADDPLGKPDKRVAYIDPSDPNAGWDPTDEREENPWREILDPPELLAVPVTQTIELDGREMEFSCYALFDEGGNATYYVRARDLAVCLDGTPARFAVGHYGVVNLARGWAYTPNGSEGRVPFSGEQPCRALDEPTNVDGELLELEGIRLLDGNGGGYTYYKLRDLGRALGFNVGWNGDRGVFLETDRAYDPAD